LALSVIGFNEGTIGSLSEYICPSIVSDGGAKFGSLESSELCPHCEQIPCEWSVYGPTVVDSVRATHGTMSGIVMGSETCLKTKSYRHDAYCTYTRTKFGYLVKGRRIPLLARVLSGIKDIRCK
jgi:hypothetical protein